MLSLFAAILDFVLVGVYLWLAVSLEKSSYYIVVLLWFLAGLTQIFSFALWLVDRRNNISAERKGEIMSGVQIHYEIREFDGNYDLCRVTAEGMCLGIDAEIHNQDIVARIAEALNAQVVEPVLPA